MDTRVLGLVIVFACTNVEVFGYTKDDLVADLRDVRNFLNDDIPSGYLNKITTYSEKYLNEANTSKAVQCIYAKSKWYLRMYFDPLMAGFVQYESLPIDTLGDKVDNADYTDQSALALLYTEIVNLKATIQKDFPVWIEYISLTLEMVNDRYKVCLTLK